MTPLSTVDREQLIDHWHRAVAEKLERIGSSTEKLPAQAQALKATLRQNWAIARLTTTPLLTAVICALHREWNQRLPETLDELYEALCQMLLHRREAESLDLAGFPEAYRQLTYPEKRRLVRVLAHDMVLNGRSDLDKSRALRLVSDILKLLNKFEGAEATILEGLLERSGMMREPVSEKVDFIHNTFKEYLAAEVFAERGDDGLLASNAFEPEWLPVLVFAVLRGNESFNAKLIRQILQRPGEPAKARERERQITAVLLEASARFLEKDVRETVAQLRQRLFPPTTMGEAASLAAAGDKVVPFLSRRKKLPANKTAACVRALRLIGSEAAREALKGYLNETRWTVIEELTLAVDPLNIAAVRQALLTNELRSHRIRSQIRDVSRLFERMATHTHVSPPQSLDLSFTQVQDISPLANLSSLQSLDLSSTQVQDISPLANLSSLQRLNLSFTQVQDISPLANLSSLQSLDLSFTQVQDLSPLANLSSLQSLDLGRPHVQDLSPLSVLVDRGLRIFRVDSRM